MKKTSRIKIKLPTLTTRDDAEFAMNTLAMLVISQRKLIADRDAAVLRINENTAVPLASCESQIASLTDQLRAWSEANPSEFPKNAKSIKLTSGILGFRTGTPKLSLISRAWSWEKVLTAMKQISEMAAGFIRTKEGVNKEELIGFYSLPEYKPHAERDLRRIGLKVTQDETFYVEPDLTKLADRQVRQTSEAA